MCRLKLFQEFFLFFLAINCASCEWFSSLGQMEDLINYETDLLSSLRQYIEAEEAKLYRIKRFADEYRQIPDNALSNIDRYLGHPVNQYKLVKRLASEWSKVEDIVLDDRTSEFLSNLSMKRRNLPAKEDVKGSAQAIMRLQDTYMLDTHDIAQGVIKGFLANDSLTPEDCFHIGRTAYLDEDYYHCALWMKEAAQTEEHRFPSLSRFDVLDHLSFCLAQQGHIKQAYDIAGELLQMEPAHDRLIGNRNHYKKLLSAQDIDYLDAEANSSDTLVREPDNRPEFAKYESLCRSEKDIYPKEVERRLKCYFWTNNNHPRLILRPVKMEEIWDSPHLVRFYDVVSDDEIITIKAISKPRLYRATVHNPLTGVLEHAQYRVSKSAWLTDDDSPVIAKVNQRISDLTGLSMETAEELQIANYGVGGQYEPHYDFTRKTDAARVDEAIGNRVATFLIYLTNVDYGGSTVFLYPSVAVKPVKGSAVFWYNLFPSGDGDMRTRHAACPVLTGVKWVSNKWIHERGQELRHRCLLQSDADNRIF